MSDNEGQTSKSSARINLRDAFENPVNLDFALPGLLSDDVGVLVAPGGTGKSFMMLGIAASVALGYDKWDYFGRDDDGWPAQIKQGRVIIVNAEDSDQLIRSRLHSLGKHFDEQEIETIIENMDVVSAVGRGFKIAQLGEGGRVEPTEAFLRTTKNMAARKPRLVIWETVNRLSAGLDENSNGQMGAFIALIEAFNQQVGCASLLVHHTSKAASWAGATDMQQAGRGASAITDNGRWQVNLGTLGREEAELRGVDDMDRRSWVKMELSKVNAVKPVGMRWLKREDGGILRGYDAGPGREPEPTKPREKKAPKSPV